MPFPFQEALSFSDHLLAGGFAFLFAVAGACVCGGSVFALIAKSRASESMDPRWDGLALSCAKTTRDLAAWAVSPLGLGLWVVMMAQRPRMMEQLHSIFLGPALVGLLLFGLGLCFSQKHIASWGRSRHESRHHLTWGLVSATGFWGAAAVLVSACAFSAHTGGWVEKPVLSNALWNPTFPAALLTWAALSVSAFGAYGLLYAATRKDIAWRVALVHELGKWMVAGAAAGVLGWIWWGISLPESPNQKLVFWLVAVAVAAQAILGGIAYRWGVRDPEMQHWWHPCAASVLVVLLISACGWAYAAAKGNFHIHQYMYRNGIIIEEAENSNQTGLWKFVNLGESMPAQGELGAFSFRAQCMACHADWVESQDSARLPRFRYEGDALRFLGDMRSQHPPYPLLAGAPEERRALAAYLETLIAESGRTLAPRPDPPRAETKPSVRPAVVSKTSTEGAEKRSENSEANTPEVVEKGAAAPVLSPPDAEQGPERAQEAKKSEKEDRPVGSPAPPNDAQDGARALDAGKPEEREDVSPVPPGPPAEKQDAISVPEAKIPPEKESTAASATRLNDAPGNNVEKSTGSAGAEDKGVASKASLLPPTDESGAGKSQDVDMPENYGQGGAAPPAPLSGAPDAENPADGESVPAAPSAPPNDSQDAKLPEEKNSP